MTSVFIFKKNFDKGHGSGVGKLTEVFSCY